MYACVRACVRAQAADEEWLDGLLSSKLEVLLKSVWLHYVSVPCAVWVRLFVVVRRHNRHAVWGGWVSRWWWW